MPAPHDLTPPAETEEEFRARRRSEIAIAFELHYIRSANISSPGRGAGASRCLGPAPLRGKENKAMCWPILILIVLGVIAAWSIGIWSPR